MKAFIAWIKTNKWAAILVLVVLMIGIVFGLRNAKRKDEASLSEPLKRGAISDSVYGIGTVTANRSLQVKSGVTSTILDLYVKEGDLVKKGARLVKLDGVGDFLAPFSGTITSLPFKTGETVFGQSIIMTLTDLSDRYVVVSLEQVAVLRVKVGQVAKISFDGMRDVSYEGVVHSIYSNGPNFLVRINTDGLPSEILPGMTGDVAILIQEHQDALSVPVAAIQGGKVLVREGGNERPVEIKTGFVDGAFAEVTSPGLSVGDRLVIHTDMNSNP
jgi:multidrug efflux pump subunit AcrA (membrane-fusion protein)